MKNVLGGAVDSHRNNLVGDVVLVVLLHVLQQLVDVGQEVFLCSAKPVVNLIDQSSKRDVKRNRCRDITLQMSF